MKLSTDDYHRQMEATPPEGKAAALTRISREASVLLLAATAGVWGYATLAGALKTIEPYWWGGKGWFIPVFGTMTLTIGAIPSQRLVQAIFDRMRTSRASLLALSAIGLTQGLSVTPTAQWISICMKLLFGIVGVQPRGWEDLVFATWNLFCALAIGASVPSVIICWYIKRQPSQAIPSARDASSEQ